MKESPIIFSTDMVKLIMDGVKTQTRRLDHLKEINKEPGAWLYLDGSSFPTLGRATFFNEKDHSSVVIKSHYQVGSRLWVKETLFRNPYFDEAGYVADDSPVMVNETIGDMLKWRWKRDILPAMFMPREAYRILLEITEVRTERLQEITEDDCYKEGCQRIYKNEALDWYKNLWDSLNAKRGYGWEANPFVWVLGFRMIKQ